ncbi:MAG: methyltransferase domain-containing protein [Chloroflexi bacterium]|nr:methyltransferase domain-containing protein [Chloroflexota bacterium]
MDYEPESTTVWSFPERGSWATHNGTYRGNWSPYVPRNLILKYTVEGDTVLDQMCGSGTTLVECKLLGRNGIGVDINPQAVDLTLRNLDFDTGDRRHQTRVYVGDSRNLNDIQNESVDLIATHPPYAGMIAYSRRTIDGDLSALSVPIFTTEMYQVARECIRVLKPGKYCGILIGDTRKHLHYVPISFLVENVFLKAGFLIKEDIIKLQWKAKGTRERWRGKSYDFYKIAHEHLFVFRKPKAEEKLSEFKLSSCGLLSVVASVGGCSQTGSADNLLRDVGAGAQPFTHGPDPR